MTGQAGAVLYTRAGCPLCFALGRLAARSSRRHRVGLVEVDVDADPALAARYGDKVPVLVLPGGRSIGGRAGAWEVDESFGRAASFLSDLEAIAPAAGRSAARRLITWLRRELGMGEGRTGGRTP